MIIREYNNNDLQEMVNIWNEVIKLGAAFPDEEYMNTDTAREYFAKQTYAAVAIDDSDGTVVALYTLHPNNIGRCGHICNASYAVKATHWGKGIGEGIVIDCLNHARQFGFKIMQFNSVLECNHRARHLYEKLGFVQVGTIPCGYRMDDGHYENICVYFLKL